ncbi:hypothetical protein KCP69_00825 [Salmonella enterica subsp. enterica]|nr:hypothetical protein KCP69_00825 [Salmonella enterica subsp. enterica]
MTNRGAVVEGVFYCDLGGFWRRTHIFMSLSKSLPPIFLSFGGSDDSWRKNVSIPVLRNR